jgi:pimeloyl-ACP methyl ester carboxylesterase
MTAASTVTAPKPDTIVHYVAYSTPSGKQPNGKLCVFGDLGSPKTALLCAGFPDDHTVFLPFAKALSQEGNILVGVMCLPGFDDRPEDGVPWQSHPREGFSFDETAKAVREASKALKGISTHERPEFTGIFHDWGAVSGSIWAQQVEQEARDDASVLRPDKIVYFDVLVAPPRTAPAFIHPSDAPQPTLYHALCYLYQVVLAICSFMQLYLPRQLAVAFVVPCFFLLVVAGVFPLYRFDIMSDRALYGDRKPGPLRMMAMSYMYRNLFTAIWSSSFLFPFNLHEDWKATPILYLYGKKKRTMYHIPYSLVMLKREEAENRSLSKAVGLEGAGHFLYVHKQDECLKHVLEFVNADNKFVS